MNDVTVTLTLDDKLNAALRDALRNARSEVELIEQGFEQADRAGDELARAMIQVGRESRDLRRQSGDLSRAINNVARETDDAFTAMLGLQGVAEATANDAEFLARETTDAAQALSLLQTVTDETSSEMLELGRALDVLDSGLVKTDNSLSELAREEIAAGLAAEELGDEAVEAARDLDDMSRSADRAARAVDNAGDQATGAAAELTVMGSAARAASRGVSRLRSGLSAIAGIGAGIGATLGILSAGTLAFGNSVISAASDAEESFNKFDVVFGDQADRVSEQIDRIAASVGRSRFEIRTAAAGFQDFLVPFGLTREEASRLSVGFSQLAIDVGSFANRQDADVVRDFQSALAGQTETVRKYGVNLLEANLKQLAYERGIADVGAQLTELQKLQVRTIAIFEGTRDAQGDAARTIDSYANSLKVLQAGIQDVQVSIGEALIPQVQNVIERLGGAEAITDSLRSTLRLLGVGFTVVVDTVGIFAQALFAASEEAGGTGKALTETGFSLIELRRGFQLTGNTIGLFSDLTATGIAGAIRIVQSSLKAGAIALQDFANAGIDSANTVIRAVNSLDVFDVQEDLGQIAAATFADGFLPGVQTVGEEASAILDNLTDDFLNASAGVARIDAQAEAAKSSIKELVEVFDLQDRERAFSDELRRANAEARELADLLIRGNISLASFADEAKNSLNPFAIALGFAADEAARLAAERANLLNSSLGVEGVRQGERDDNLEGNLVGGSLALGQEGDNGATGLDALTRSAGTTDEILAGLNERVGVTAFGLGQVAQKAIEAQIAYQEAASGIMGARDAFQDYGQTLSDNTLANDVVTGSFQAIEGNIGQLSRSIVEGKANFSDFAKSVVKDIATIITQALLLRAIRGLLGFGEGGELTGGGFASLFFRTGGITPGTNLAGGLPTKAFRRGGIISEPTIALAGEGQQKEAVVPLNDGRSIPVRLKGGDGTSGNGGGPPVTLNVNVNAIDRRGVSEFFNEHARELGNAIANARESNASRRLTRSNRG